MADSELRQDPATREWVVIAPERAARPRLTSETNHVAGPADPTTCPFCPGHEHMTPPELVRIPDDGSWMVRVVPNKFGALKPDATPFRRQGFFRCVAGAGHHEVIIEHPNHHMELADMPEEHISRILQAYQRRHIELARDKVVQFVIVFRNYGERAGTSLSHPHSQLLATPVVPAYMRWKHEVAEGYYDDNNRNLYLDIMEAERNGPRLVEANNGFAVFVPFASAAPYEMWIMPQIPRPSFALASQEELVELAGSLRRSLLRLRHCCGDVHYNYVIHSCTTRDEGEEYYVWHLQIIPRLTQPAGFELGSHMYINPSSPEKCADELRRAPVSLGPGIIQAA